jgi:hypothetical protein
VQSGRGQGPQGGGQEEEEEEMSYDESHPIYTTNGMLEDGSMSMRRLPLLAVSIGGVTSEDVHPIVEDLVRQSVKGARFLRLKGEPVTFPGDVKRALDAIEAQPLCERLIIVGKSAGGIMAWCLAQESRLIRRYPEPVIMLIDAHGAVNGDDRFGPYCERQDLHSDGIPDGPKFFNVYQYNQHKTGARLRSDTFENVRIGDQDVNHENITQHWLTKQRIRRAIEEVTRCANMGIR